MSPDAGSIGVGMKNVMERLRLYFHDRARLSIFSEGKNTGTEVLIIIPEKADGELESEDDRCTE